MKTADPRELRDRLFEYLREVRSGESVLVIDRGEVVAELSAPGYAIRDASVPDGLLSLAKRGLMSLGGQSGAGLYPSLPRRKLGKRSLARLLGEERGAH